MKKIDASHWHGRLAGTLILAFILWALGAVSDVLFSGESWDYAGANNAFPAVIVAVVWFTIFTIWPNAGRPEREPVG